MNSNLLEHAVINQFESDLENRDYDSISEMLVLLIKNKESRHILTEFLGDSAKENLIEGRTSVRY